MHPIDRLGEIRQQIRKLRIEAKVIVEQLASGECSARGEHYSAMRRVSVLVTPIPRSPDVVRPTSSYQSLAGIARSDAPISH